jgi:hypothetical protein
VILVSYGKPIAVIMSFSSKSDVVQNRKETADKIVESVMKKGMKRAGLSEDFIEDCSNFKKEDGKYLMEIPEKRLSSQDSTDNAEINIKPEFINEGFVGDCDICGHISKELWEHEELGDQGFMEKNVCKTCLRSRFVSAPFGSFDDEFEKFLSKKRKLVPNLGRSPKILVRVIPAAKFNDFNPIPKPVKKEKK